MEKAEPNSIETSKHIKKEESKVVPTNVINKDAD